MPRRGRHGSQNRVHTTAPPQRAYGYGQRGRQTQVVVETPRNIASDPDHKCAADADQPHALGQKIIRNGKQCIDSCQTQNPLPIEAWHEQRR